MAEISNKKAYYLTSRTSAKDLYGKSVSSDLEDLYNSWLDSPYLCIKNTDYFPVYSEILSKFRDKNFTLIEIGVLDGGSLFMWRKWLGDQARIIGVDLNPAANKWASHGFEIFIGDQSDPNFWNSFFKKVKSFDVVIDDGGHESHQQIVSVLKCMEFASKKSCILVEDTQTSFMKSFSSHGKNSFLQFSKDSTDLLVARQNHEKNSEFPSELNTNVINAFKYVYSIQFFSGIVCFKINPETINHGFVIRNIKGVSLNHDYRLNGVRSITIDWPYAFKYKKVRIDGMSVEDIQEKIKQLKDSFSDNQG